MPKLVIQGGEKRGMHYRVTDETLTIGRAPSNTVVLSDPLVSRRHARISAEGKRFIIEDLGSVNGTLVNNQPVTRQALRVGDVITLGKTAIRFLHVHAPDGAAPQGRGFSGSADLLSETDNALTVQIALMPEAPVPPGNLPQAFDPSGIKKAYEHLSILYKLIRDLMTIEDLAGVLRKTLERVMEIVNGDRGLIVLVDQESGDLVPYGSLRKEGLADRSELSLSRAMCRVVLESGRSILTSDAQKDDRFQGSESVMIQKIHSAMSAPIQGRDRVLGVIHVDSVRRITRFSRDDLELLTAIGCQAGIAIENAMLLAESKMAHLELQERQRQLMEAEKLTALGKIAGSVAHEVLNPMTVIMGFTELVCGRLEQGIQNPENVLECIRRLKSVEDEAKRVLQIVNSISQFYRRKKSDKTPIDVNDEIEAALGIAEYSNHGKVAVIRELGADLPRVVADRSQLQTVFLNLINNAMDAMDAKGTLTVSSTRGDDRTVKIRIADTGCGIEPAIRDKIFTPLFTTKEEGKGTGLGLSISHDIIENHGGMMDVQSTPGKGTVFTVVLPVHQAGLP
jgi:two-component system, NtrC family, sensor kinase